MPLILGVIAPLSRHFSLLIRLVILCWYRFSCSERLAKVVSITVTDLTFKSILLNYYSFYIMGAYSRGYDPMIAFTVVLMSDICNRCLNPVLFLQEVHVG